MNEHEFQMLKGEHTLDKGICCQEEFGLFLESQALDKSQVDS